MLSGARICCTSCSIVPVSPTNGTNTESAPASRNGREHLIAADALAVRVPEAEGNARAGRREGGEARFDEDASTAGVPGVGEDEHRPLDVEAPEDVGLIHVTSRDDSRFCEQSEYASGWRDRAPACGAARRRACRRCGS